MGLLNWLGRRLTNMQAYPRLFSGISTRSAIPINQDTALQTSVVLCAARVIAEGIAQCPLKLYLEEEDEDSEHTVRKVARNHPLYNKLAHQPCWMTKFEFIELITMHAVVEGNGYALIVRSKSKPGNPVTEIIPIPPDWVEVVLNPNFERTYKVTLFGRQHELKPEEILHLKGPAWMPDLGLNVRERAREAIGLSKAMERSHADLYGRGGRPDGQITTDVPLTQSVAEDLRDAWVERYGPNGEGGVAVLDNGAKYSSIEMTAIDAQLIENRKFQVEEIARYYRVFPLMLMSSDKTATFASISEFLRAHVIHSLVPWFERWEGVLKRDLIGFDDDNADIFPRFDLDGLLKGSPKELAEMWKALREMGIVDSNFIRAKLKLNPRPGGDDYLTPLNMRVNGQEPADDGKESPTVQAG